MAITIKRLFAPTVLGTAAGTLYTAPANTVMAGGQIHLLNTSTGAVTVTVYAVPAGGTAGDGNAVIKGRSLAAGDYLLLDIPVLASGDFLQALASAATSITASCINGREFVG